MAGRLLMTDTELVQAMKVIREYYGVGVTSEAMDGAAPEGFTDGPTLTPKYDTHPYC